MVKDTIKKKNLEHITCKGLSIESEGNGHNMPILAKVEIMCANEQGVKNVLTLLNALDG